jgi:hypothetical protein
MTNGASPPAKHPSGSSPVEPLGGLMGLFFRAHPWHGVAIGDDAPEIVTLYVEIVPTDTVKYEIDKVSGYLKVDRPQKYSNVCPTLYGFVPRTYCTDRVTARLRRHFRPDRRRPPHRTAGVTPVSGDLESRWCVIPSEARDQVRRCSRSLASSG